ncbi:MAG TPA: NAD(P)-dependent oxidoreductase [Candidatus Methanoperedens sp.]|nr:NAD(P)-dependent oxidoreductase [Candidatus Methanoperedens sp.]
MKDYKIAFFGVKSWEREEIEKEIADLDATGVGIFGEELEGNLEMAKNYNVVSISSRSKVDKEILEKLCDLRMIAVRSTGIDNIDVEECKSRGIEIKNVPSYGSNTVAEYTFALILAVSKKLVEAHQTVENDEFSPEGLTGIDLHGRTLGIIGLGKIGSNVAKIGRGFGMNIVAVEKYPDDKVVKRYKVKLVDMDTLLKNSDVVTLHVPSEKDTYHLINRDNIKQMKKGSILVNTSRGAVLESAAVIWALNKGVLMGAGIDVVEEEENLEGMSMIMSQRPTKDDLQNILSYHMLRDRDDVVFTPHNAFNTKEAITRRIKTTIENINNFCKK